MSELKKISRFEFAIMKIADPVEAEKHEPYTEVEELEFREQKLIASAKLMSVKKWINLKNVLKEFKCGYSDLIIKSSTDELKPTIVGGIVYFFRDDLEKIFSYKVKRSN